MARILALLLLGLVLGFGARPRTVPDPMSAYAGATTIVPPGLRTVEGLPPAGTR